MVPPGEKMLRRIKLDWAYNLKMSKVPRVNKGMCISCGVCVDTAPAVFRFDEENRAEVYDPNGADAAAIQEAIELCPVTCIYWEEEG